MKLTKFWVVRDPTRLSEMGDILFPMTSAELPRVILGTGLVILGGLVVWADTIGGLSHH